MESIIMKNKPKILLVDDKIENIIALEKLFSELDVDCVRAMSGNEALKKTLENDFALVLMDVQMPDMNGYETVNLMRQEKKNEHLTVIFISAIYSEDYYKVKGVETGAVDFITKPVNPKILTGKIRVHLDLYRQRASLQGAYDKLELLVQERTAELRESEERFRLALTGSTITVFNQDKDLRYTWVYNPNSKLNVEYVLGKTDEDLIPPHEARVLTEMKRRVMESGVGERQEHSFTVGSETSYYMTSIEPMIDRHGECAGIIGISTDITERKKAVEDIERIFNLSAYMVCIASIDGYFLKISPAFTETLGHSEEELLGRPFLDFVHEDDKERTLAVMKEKLEKGIEVISFENRYRCKDGSYKWLAWTARPFVEEDLLYAIAYDITERKLAEEALLESEERFRTVFTQASDAIVLIETETGRFVEFNDKAHKLLGYTREEFQELSLTDMEVLETSEMVREHIDHILQEGHDVFETQHRTKDGDIRDVLVNANTISIWDKQYVLSIWRDITESKRAEEERLKLEAQVQQAQKMESLGVLAGGIAHDFNNLLMGVLGYADLALTEISPASPAQNSIREIVNSARRAAELSQQMLAYSGKGRFVIEKISLSEIVEEMGHLVESSVSKKAIIKYNFADELPAIEADVTQIRQVIMNLMINASEALGEEGGIVNITTGVMECGCAYLRKTYLDEKQPEGRYVYLEISDTGCGMDKKTVEKIFDPFFSTKFAGRGLGLAALIGIVRGHRGAVKVESKPGKGTSIRVLFPALLEPAEPLTVPPEAVEGWKGSGTVLLIDDEEVVLEVAGKMLKKIGFKVLSARGGSEAIELLQQHNNTIACVLLDLTMPRMDGDQVLEELHRIRGDLRVIISSGYSEEEIEGRFAGKRLSGFIQKPYTLKNLTTTMKQALMV